MNCFSGRFGVRLFVPLQVAEKVRENGLQDGQHFSGSPRSGVVGDNEDAQRYAFEDADVL